MPSPEIVPSTRSGRVRRLLSALTVATLIAAACGGGDDVSSAPSTEAPAGTAAAAQPAASEDGLVIGTLLPVTGDLAFLGPPETAGARLAIADINAAGGVLGAPVTLHEADSGDTTQDIANPEVDRLLALGADVIVGAASSAVSKLVIDKITGAGVIQFAPSNTSPDFTDYPDRGLYFRTAPSDLLQSRVLAELVASEGAETAGVIYRQESYGQGLADAFLSSFETLGGTVEPFIAYVPGTENFDAEVDLLVQADPEAVLIIGFEESAAIVTTMHERGVGPTSDTHVYGVAGNISGIGAGVADPSILAGMRGPETSVDLDSIRDFTDRLETAYEGGLDGVYTYGAETYDAVIIAALAAEAAGSTDPSAIASRINDITRGGQKCHSFAECREVIAAGDDPDYEGAGGPYEFTDAGEPSVASYRIASYDGGRRPNEDLDEYRLVGRQAEAAGPAEGDGLVIGTFLPVGDSAIVSGPARVAAARLAVSEINDAGGVLGREVNLHEADSSGAGPTDAVPRISRLLDLGVDAVVGAAASAVSLLIIDEITGRGVIQISPSNTSPAFTDHPDRGLYFRTAPSDAMLGRVMAEWLPEQGTPTIGVLFRDDAWGRGLAEVFRPHYEALGGEIALFRPYDPDQQTFEAEAEALAQADPDAIWLIAFRETAEIVIALHERGIGPTSAKQVYGGDNISALGAWLPDPSIISGMRGITPSVDLDSVGDFTARLADSYEGNLEGATFVPQTYDAVVIVALAAEMAGSTDPATVAAEINDITRGGQECFDFVGCRAVIAAGGDPDYTGPGGPYAFTDGGEPSSALYRIVTYRGELRPDPSLNEYIVAGP